ncbi:alpha-hydroxy acid oxidase [Amorphus sp. 3PC139-8]|uniref:alpha-hydroxy acid oxidase n=1 Tax=Amorphus sp. 3PC139-8 TaxID=2735676 RepID=UPI00345E0030
MAGSWSSVDDLRLRARRRLPRFAFDFIDGGAGNEASLGRNVEAYRQATLVPRILRNVDGDLATETTLFGRTWRVPFGVAPIGMAGIAWPGIDGWLAAGAERAGAPYTASTPATATLEELRTAAPTVSWFQLYVGREQRIVDDLLHRAEAAGYETLLVTADVPKPGKRLRDIRNSFMLPLRPSVRMALDVAIHPGWSWAIARSGSPRFCNLERYTKNSSASSLAEFMASQSSGRLDWALFDHIRKTWKGRIALKGVLSPEDAVEAARRGADAVVVSNHGGRQLASAPATLHALGAVRDALGPDFTVLLDGGIRSGEDILKGLLAGADFVLMGRPFVFAVGAYGQEGAERVFELLRAELVNAMGQIGLSDIADRGAFTDCLCLG